jgi:branched-subunit amino acid transport protein
VSTDLVWLALLMAAVTYPARVIPLLVPQMRRLPPIVLTYLRLVGPAVLASLAAVSLVVRADASGRPTLYFGLEWLAVAVCVAIVAWRRNLLIGLAAAAALMAVARAIGIGVV